MLRGAGPSLTARAGRRSGIGCHRHRIFLDNRELFAGKCCLSTDNGSTRGHLWPATHVLRIGTPFHHREHHLRDRSNSTRNARRSHNPRHRRWRHIEREPDNLIGPRATSAASEVPRLHTTGLFLRDVPCANHWRPHGKDRLAMVSSSAKLRNL